MCVYMYIRACIYICICHLVYFAAFNGAAKGRTNIELREQFILADGVSQSMAAFTSRRSTPNAAQTANSSQNGAGSPNLPPYMSGQGPIIKVNQQTYLRCGLTKQKKSKKIKIPFTIPSLIPYIGVVWFRTSSIEEIS